MAGSVIFTGGVHLWNERGRAAGGSLMALGTLVIGGGFALMVAYAIQQMPLL